MISPRTRTSRVANERGSVLLLVVFSLIVFLGLAALAIDLGILYVARSEAQRSADAGAHAGAGVFLFSPDDVARARSQARSYAESNPVRWADLEVREHEDVDVIPDSQKVRVRVYRAQERGNPVATLFARVLGLHTVDIGARAAAQAWPAIGVDCALPFAVPDHWYVNDPQVGLRPAGASDVYDEDRGDLYIPASNPDASGFYTGYGRNRVGQQIVVKPASPSGAPQPGWYYPIRFPETQGADDYREAIRDCWEPTGILERGDEVNKEPGNMTGPTRQGFRDLIDQEPGAYWDDSCKCPRNAAGEALGAENPRVRPLVMFDPRDWRDIAMGSKPVPISAIAGVFIEDIVGGDAVVRWMFYTGVRPAPEWDPNDASLARILRIIE